MRKTPKPKAPKPFTVLQETRMLNSVTPEGVPLGKQGPHILTWMRPSASGVFFLINVESSNAERLRF